MAKNKESTEESADRVEAVFTFVRESAIKNEYKFASTAVAMIRAAGIGGVKAESLIQLIRERTPKIPLDTLRKTVKGTQKDIGLAIAQMTLDKRYASGDHLIRTMDRSFWEYTGTHWRSVTDDMVKNRVLAVVEHVNPPGSFSHTMTCAFNLLVASQAAQGDVLRFTEEPPPVINCRNGELWFDDTGGIDFRKHRADSFLTYVLDVDFVEKDTCPEFDSALLATFEGDTDLVEHWNEFMGYMIQPKRDVASWFVLYGSGNNGKTKLMETALALISKEAILATRIDELEKDKFVIGALLGKLVAIDDDADARTRLPDGTLKKLSERKIMSGQLKQKNVFQFIACALPVILCNNWPRINDLSRGTRRRAHVIPFHHHFVKGKDEDPKIFDRIQANEMSGVLNRAIEGLQRLRERGWFEDPEASVLAKAEFFREAHPLPAFIAEECEVYKPTKDDRPWLLTHFYAVYSDVTAKAGIKHIEPRNKIMGHLKNLGYEVVEVGGHKTAVVGLRRRAKWDPDRESEPEEELEGLPF